MILWIQAVPVDNSGETPIAHGWFSSKTMVTQFEMVTGKYTVLAIDDSADDLLLLEMAFRNSKRLKLVHKCCGGEEGVAYLHGDGEFADRDLYPIPDLILLDLKMPRVTGFEVLEDMRNMSLPKQPVVVVFSCSALPKDMHRAYALGARFYQVKPSTFSELGAVMKQLESYLDLIHSDGACVA